MPIALDSTVLNALTTEWATQKAGLDDQENRYRINYQQALQKMKQQTGLQHENLAISAADRGLTHSGPTIQGDLKIQSDFNTAAGNSAQNVNLDLATVARKRLEADAAYEAQKAMYLAGLQPQS